MAIKRNITDISALKRGANNVTAVYRGTTLIWPMTPPSDNNTWLTNGLDLILNETNSNIFVARGINIKFR